MTHENMRTPNPSQGRSQGTKKTKTAGGCKLKPPARHRPMRRSPQSTGEAEGAREQQQRVYVASLTIVSRRLANIHVAAPM